MTESALVATAEVSCCPVCGAAERAFLFEGYDHLHGLPGRFPVARCIACGVGYLTRRPADLAPYYPSESYAAYAGAESAGPGSPALGRDYGLRQRRRLLVKLKPRGGRLLDVGCGAGDFLSLMQATSGWQVEGLEPNSQAVRYVREVRGLQAWEGVLPRPDLAGRRYDVVTLWHVLEHTAEPAAVLADVKRLLKPDGVLVVSLPAADSLEAAWFGANWAGYDVPRHLVTFTRSGFMKFAARLGFQMEEQYGIVEGLASLRLSLAFWLSARGELWQRFRRPLTLPLLLPLFLYARLRGSRRLGVAVFVGRPASRVAG